MNQFGAKRRFRVGVLLAALLGTVTGVTATSLPTAETAKSADYPMPEIPLTVGLGEKMVLVVGGMYDTVAEARAAADAMPFGDLHGFFLDESSHYLNLGFFAQTSPHKHRLQCGIDLDQLHCPQSSATPVYSYPSISLTYASNAEGSLYLAQHASDPCGSIEQPPCLSETTRYLGGDLTFIPGKTLLLSAFRTAPGAIEFMELARATGIPVIPVAFRVQKIAGPYVGLGWETAPTGDGMLLQPMSPVETERWQTDWVETS